MDRYVIVLWFTDLDVSWMLVVVYHWDVLVDCGSVP